MWLLVITPTVLSLADETLTSDWCCEIQMNDLSARRGEVKVCARLRKREKLGGMRVLAFTFRRPLRPKLPLCLAPLSDSYSLSVELYSDGNEVHLIFPSLQNDGVSGTRFDQPSHSC